MSEQSSETGQPDNTRGEACSTSGCPSCFGGKFLLVMLLGLAIAYLLTSRPSLPPAAPSAVNWAQDYDQALAAAAQKNQPVLLAFKASWCGPCRMMENEVFAKPVAAKALSDWIPVHVDIDEQRQLARQYEISGVPTLVALSPEGKEIARAGGVLSLEEFGQFLASAEAQLNQHVSRSSRS
jgi:thiol:disulfide interchange protein